MNIVATKKSIRPDCWRFFTCQNENQDRMNGFTIIIWSTLFQCGAHFISRAPKFSNNNHWHLQCYDSTQYQTAIPFLFSIQETHMQMLSTRGSFVRTRSIRINFVTQRTSHMNQRIWKRRTQTSHKLNLYKSHLALLWLWLLGYEVIMDCALCRLWLATAFFLHIYFKNDCLFSIHTVASLDGI